MWRCNGWVEEGRGSWVPVKDWKNKGICTSEKHLETGLKWELECGSTEQHLNWKGWELAPGIWIIQHQRFLKKPPNNSKGCRAKCNPVLAKCATFSQNVISFLKKSPWWCDTTQGPEENPSNDCREETDCRRAPVTAAALIVVWYTKEKEWKTCRERTGKRERDECYSSLEYIQMVLLQMYDLNLKLSSIYCRAYKGRCLGE